MPKPPAPLSVDRLRPLTLDPRSHPRGQAHLSAASGLVCTLGRAYVIGDDEQHLAIYSDRGSAGQLQRVLAGDLPRAKAARKRRKADFESLLWLPQQSALIALGSGSRPQRDRGIQLPLDADGSPRLLATNFDLAPLYEPLRARMGSLNIEGAVVVGDELILLQRGHAGSASMSLHYALSDFQDAIAGQRSADHPPALRPYSLGAIDGAPLALTDGTALPGGGWAFTAVAEASDDSYADGPCRGSAVGVVAADGTLQSLRRLALRDKVEGIAALADARGTAIFMVTDADDPAQASWLLSARL